MSQPLKLKGTDLTACPLIAPNHRSSGHGWELVCGKPWQPKWHSQLGPSLVQLRSRASLHTFCRNAWGFSSAPFYCPWAPAKGSSGHNPPGSALTHRGSTHLSKGEKSDKYMNTRHWPGITWGGMTGLSKFEHTWSEVVLVKFDSLVSHKPCRRMGFHRGEDWTWDIFPGGSSLTVRISGVDSDEQIWAMLVLHWNIKSI